MSTKPNPVLEASVSSRVGFFGSYIAKLVDEVRIFLTSSKASVWFAYHLNSFRVFNKSRSGSIALAKPGENFPKPLAKDVNERKSVLFAGIL